MYFGNKIISRLFKEYSGSVRDFYTCKHLKFISKKSDFNIMAKSASSRGSFIVVEGCDGAGKTTQCKNLVEHLNKNGLTAKYINFPARDTPCGSIINSYLTNNQDLPDEAIHLLFTFNRWETKNKMIKLLNEGTTLIVDRYSYSGVAYSTAKGLDFEWCKAPEAGLLKPDLVLFLSITPETQAKRNGFGKERYEKTELQRKVWEVFERMKDDAWLEVDANKSKDIVLNEIISIVEKCVRNTNLQPLKYLW